MLYKEITALIRETEETALNQYMQYKVPVIYFGKLQRK